MCKIQTIHGDIFIDENFTGLVHVSNSEKHHYENGKLSKSNGPAVIYANGDKFYYKDNLLHRLDGPAIDADGCKYYYVEGKLHRLEGPAILFPNTFKEYWINGKKYDKKTHEEIASTYKKKVK